MRKSQLAKRSEISPTGSVRILLTETCMTNANLVHILPQPSNCSCLDRVLLPFLVHAMDLLTAECVSVTLYHTCLINSSAIVTDARNAVPVFPAS